MGVMRTSAEWVPPLSSLSRRDLLRIAGAGLAAVAGACSSGRAPGSVAVKDDGGRRKDSLRGRLTARPSAAVPAAGSHATGLLPLGLAGSNRDGALYVPVSYRAERPAPLVVVLHGAYGTGRRELSRLLPLADEAGILLLAPDSRESTWDAVMGVYGPDVAFLDRALEQTFARYAVDPARIAAEGFSDGASYALSLGITNGDLFTHAMAFSPGLTAAAARHGSPKLFISHGTRDEVLPIDRCSRRIVPMLRRDGYDVLYQEFEGPHIVPAPIVRRAVDWFLSGA